MTEIVVKIGTWFLDAYEDFDRVLKKGRENKKEAEIASSSFVNNICH